MKHDSQPTARLRKFIRQPERYAERYGTFQMTARDLDVLQVVFRYRHLTADHIRALIPGSDQHLGRRLAGLFHHAYLARYAPLDRMRFELNAGSPVMAYGLDTKGWRTLQFHNRVPLGEHLNAALEDAADGQAWRKAHSRRTSWFLEHQLGIANFRCVLELALKERPGDGLSLVLWDQTTATRGEVRLKDKTVLRVNPDAFFALRDGSGAIRNFFLEFDSGTEEQRRIEAKFRRYWWWLQAPAYRAAHRSHERVAVLFATSGIRRLENMMATLARMPKPNNPPYGGRGWIRFCLETDYGLENPRSLLSPIWRTLSPGNKTLPLF